MLTLLINNMSASKIYSLDGDPRDIRKVFQRTVMYRT